MYPRLRDIEAFEKAYGDEHVPMAIAKLAGKTKMVGTRILGSPQGTPPFHRIAEIYFPSMDDLEACAASEGGKRVCTLCDRSRRDGILQRPFLGDLVTDRNLHRWSESGGQAAILRVGQFDRTLHRSFREFSSSQKSVREQVCESDKDFPARGTAR
jgi:uncharacterized protein (TIGR02118 family)